MLEDGSLLRVERLNVQGFNSGGKGGRIKRMDWEGNTIWQYDLADGTQHQHHDVEVLPNGNILICDGNAARIMEIDPEENLVWDYINPVSNAGPISQGTTSFNRDLFRATRYGEDYAAFEDKDMTPGDKLELNPFVDDCEIFRETSSTEEELFLNDISIAPNPTSGLIFITIPSQETFLLNVFDISGRLVMTRTEFQDSEIDLSILEPGLYFLKFRSISQHTERIIKVVRS